MREQGAGFDGTQGQGIDGLLARAMDVLDDARRRGDNRTELTAMDTVRRLLESRGKVGDGDTGRAYTGPSVVLVSVGKDGDQAAVDDFLARLPTMPRGQARVILPDNRRETFPVDFDPNDRETWPAGYAGPPDFEDKNAD